MLTPEDPFPIWSDHGSSYRIAPLFTLYDYSFRPDDIPLEQALAWAAEKDIVCVDEYPEKEGGFTSKKPNDLFAIYVAFRSSDEMELVSRAEGKQAALEKGKEMAGILNVPLREGTGF